MTIELEHSLFWYKTNNGQSKDQTDDTNDL